MTSKAGISTAPERREQSDQEEAIRQALTKSESGAPISGETVGDIFTADEIFRRIVATADEEFSVGTRLLFLSGLAAGLTISFSFLGTASLAGALGPDASILLTSLFYPLGFIFIAIGRYQLFTENTLTPVTLVLTRIASIPRLLRIWGLVLVANLLGTALAALFYAKSSVLGPEAEAAALRIGHHLAAMESGRVFTTGIVAGWLIAGMVWLHHAARSTSARLLIVLILMYTVAVADLAHCIVSSTEVLYLVFKGEMNLMKYLWEFEIPAILGNMVGGVLLVAILNYARTRGSRFPDSTILPWKEWFLGEKRERRVPQEEIKRA